MMHENLDKVTSATQNYLDMVEKTMRGFPGANQEQISTFKEYIKLQLTETSVGSFWTARIFSRSSAFRSNIFSPG